MVLYKQYCHPRESIPLGRLSSAWVHIVENAYDKPKYLNIIWIGMLHYQRFIVEPDGLQSFANPRELL